MDLPAPFLILEVHQLGCGGTIAPEEAFVRGAIFGAILDGKAGFVDLHVLRLLDDRSLRRIEGTQQLGRQVLS